ncbi:large conductance mechanosensitive channel protein MscL [Weissella halotolerans]|uniref:Large-conductance mechanosensitive channel n=1 Tax=Weissella halotolerans DSM 20190 TaxID=1123500 RepID=A0A0R2FTT6_9LACO|nr:large conductance mechanosensitive channel protein MscL [Weissella halotolerans]KRN31704.1 hypothetical protein IV68_GL000960 [Weissella halotolerans DSM 20190]
MRQFWQEFKEFLSQGNIIDMAIAFIMGGAFQVLLKSLVNDIFMPVIGIVTGSISFANIVWQIGPAKIKIGAFLANGLTFILTGLCIFIVIKALNKARALTKEEDQTDQAAPAETELDILKDIRNSLEHK